MKLPKGMGNNPGLQCLFWQSRIQDVGLRKAIPDKKTVFLMSLNHFCGRLSEKCQYLVVFHASLGICFLFYMSFFVIMMDIYNIGSLFLMISYILVAIGRGGVGS